MTIEVALGKSGKVALVDDVDAALVTDFSWCAHWTGSGWYARNEVRSNGGRIRTYMHRLLVNGIEVDHIDGNGLNNTRENLRPATRAQNSANIDQRADSRQPYKGIFQRPSGRWAAQCQGRCLGTFDTPEVAAKAYDRNARSAFGEFARLNFPEDQ